MTCALYGEKQSMVSCSKKKYERNLRQIIVKDIIKTEFVFVSEVEQKGVMTIGIISCECTVCTDYCRWTIMKLYKL